MCFIDRWPTPWPTTRRDCTSSANVSPTSHLWSVRWLKIDKWITKVATQVATVCRRWQRFGWLHCRRVSPPNNKALSWTKKLINSRLFLSTLMTVSHWEGNLTDRGVPPDPTRPSSESFVSECQQPLDTFSGRPPILMNTSRRFLFSSKTHFRTLRPNELWMTRRHREAPLLN